MHSVASRRLHFSAAIVLITLVLLPRSPLAHKVFVCFLICICVCICIITMDSSDFSCLTSRITSGPHSICVCICICVCISISILYHHNAQFWLLLSYFPNHSWPTKSKHHGGHGDDINLCPLIYCTMLWMTTMQFDMLHFTYKHQRPLYCLQKSINY